MTLLYTQFGLMFKEDRFWVIHQRRTYGPFEYQFNQDLRGLVLCYQGEAFGEVCSQEEFFIDLKPFGLPMNVAHVATLVYGWQHQCWKEAVDHRLHFDRLKDLLTEYGYAQYCPVKLA